jgi:hypothetical protein
LDKTAGYVNHLVKEATEIWLNLNNFNRWWLHVKPGLVSCDQHDASRLSKQLTPPTSP